MILSTRNANVILDTEDEYECCSPVQFCFFLSSSLTVTVILFLSFFFGIKVNASKKNIRTSFHELMVCLS